MGARGVTASAILLKQPAEKKKYGMEFSASFEGLHANDGLASIAYIVSEKVGGCDTDLSITASGISGTQVHFDIASGTHGQKYRIEVVVNTSGSYILEGDGILYVRDR